MGKLVLKSAHRLMCGDSTDQIAVARLIGAEKVGLVATDPPYGVALSGVYRKDGRTHGDAGHADIASDDSVDAATLVLDNAMAAILPHLTENAAWYVWHAHSLSVQLFGLFQKHLKRPPRALIVWRKSHFVIGRNHYHQQHEPCLYGWRENHQPPFYGERNQSTVWDVVGGGGHRHENHPTEKPTELFTRPMANHLRSEGIAYDPFAGSGSCVIAAQQAGNRCFAIELDPVYCDVTVRRFENFTGQKAVRWDG